MERVVQLGRSTNHQEGQNWEGKVSHGFNFFWVQGPLVEWFSPPALQPGESIRRGRGLLNGMGVRCCFEVWESWVGFFVGVGHTVSMEKAQWVSAIIHVQKLKV